MVFKTINPIVMENANNIEIIDNVYIENVEQDIDKEKRQVQSNDEIYIEQKENKNEKVEVCEIDQLQLVNIIRNLVHIYI